MKRITLNLLAVTLAFAFACRPQENANGNRSGNTNATANANRGNGNSDFEGIAPIIEKSVTISVADDAANPGRLTITVSPDSVNISKSKKEKIKWCVTNTSTSASGATVTVGNFIDKSDPAKKNPFGGGTEGENTFAINPADYGCNIKTKDADAGIPLTTYKYMITVTVSGVEKGKLDPQVIIDN